MRCFSILFPQKNFRTIVVDYDRDGSGIYRAKGPTEKDANEILDSSATKIDTPVDLQKPSVIDEEEFWGK